MNKTQLDAFLKSQDMFLGGRYADAVGALRELLSQLRPNTAAYGAIAARAAEAALAAGDRAYREYAIALLTPLETRDGYECAAKTLLARAYAESGQSAERDAEITALVTLHKKSKSPAALLDIFELEEHRLQGGARLQIWYALQPFGPHNTHLFSMLHNASGEALLRVELDSADVDQIDFKQTHPDLAAKGDRRYSVDAFQPDPGRSGGPGVNHASIQFFDGKPSYDTVRELMLEVANRFAAR